MNFSWLKHGVTICLAIVIVSLGLGFLGNHNIYLSKSTISIQNFLSSVFFMPSVTASDLKDIYNRAISTGRKIKILIVPGHEPTYGGAEFGTLKEREMTVALGLKLAQFFKDDRHYEVILARDASRWNSEIEAYFNKYQKEINEFAQAKKIEMSRLVAEGRIEKISSGVMHGTAVPEVATHLYGINKWSNEQDVDIIIHVHFNDYPRRNASRAGTYRGFSIYVPEAQYSNAEVTKTVAENIFYQLSKVALVSNLPKENAGVVNDQDLIAVGGRNTSEGVSLLIEYGYIYEPQFETELARNTRFETLARETYLGVENFFAKL